MLEAMRRLRTATSNLHRDMKEMADTIGTFLVDAFHLFALFAIGATSGCRASDRNGYTGCNGRNSASVIRCPGVKIRVADASEPVPQRAPGGEAFA
jgi:hypothetical protein